MSDIFLKFKVSSELRRVLGVKNPCPFSFLFFLHLSFPVHFHWTLHWVSAFSSCRLLNSECKVTYTKAINPPCWRLPECSNFYRKKTKSIKKAEHQTFLNCSVEKTLESPLDCKEIQPVPPKGDQSWVFIGRTDAEAETPIVWPPDVKNWLIGKDPDAGKDWRQEEKRTTEDEMGRWHHRLNGHESE